MTLLERKISTSTSALETEIIFNLLSLTAEIKENYEGHLESSLHGIITPQCVDKMLSNNTFLETRIQRLLDGYFLIKKGLCVHMQRMLKMSRGLYTGGNFKQNTVKKNDGKLGTLFAIFI